MLSSRSGPTLANVKMTSTADPLVEHLRRYPDVPLLYASTEAAADAAHHGLTVVGAGGPVPRGPAVVDTGLSVTGLDAQLTALSPGIGAPPPHGGASIMHALAEGPLDGLWDIGAAVAHLAAPLAGILPLGTLLTIGIRAGLRSGARTPETSGTTRARLVRATASSLTAKGVTALSHEPTLGFVAAITTSIALGGLPGARHSWMTAAERERQVQAWAGQR